MKTVNKCFMATAETVQRDWYVVDATDKILGRLAVRIATVLMGKHRPTYTPHVDTGDFVIVVNVEKIKFTGKRKGEQTVYKRYSGYPGGQKQITLNRMLRTHPERVLREAVRRMLPKNILARKMLLKLKLYAGSDHPHQAQQPEPFAF